MKYLKIIVFFLLYSSLIYSENYKINLNHARAEELVHIVKGIGVKRAELIVQYRKRNGEFKTINELGNVPRIGKNFVLKHLKELEEKLSVH